MAQALSARRRRARRAGKTHKVEAPAEDTETAPAEAEPPELAKLDAELAQIDEARKAAKGSAKLDELVGANARC